MPVVDALMAGAQTVLYWAAPVGGALIEETALLDRWPCGARHPDRAASTGWPRHAGAGHSSVGATARSARLAAETIPETAGTRLQSDLNFAQAASPPAAPLSMASPRRVTAPPPRPAATPPNSDKPAWATIAPAALRITASRTDPSPRRAPNAPRRR